MNNHFDSMLLEIEQCKSDVECRVRIVSCIRLLLQQIDYGLLEWISQQQPSIEFQPDQFVLDALRAPADGSLVDALEALLISAEQLGWVGVARILATSSHGRPAEKICGDQPRTLLGLLRGMVSIRNNGAEGHGLVGGYARDVELDALRFVIDGLADVTPILADDGVQAAIGPERLRRNLDFIRGWAGQPALIRRIKPIGAERVRAFCQIAKDADSREEFNYEAVSPFINVTGRSLPAPIIWNNSWEPFVYLPDRTTDSFTGRDPQLIELQDWLNDMDSRACLIHGDGGYGKTTLALEFLHRVLDEEVEVEWQPQMILFYTAKRWQWGLNGLKPIAAGQPHLLELLAHLYILFFGKYPSTDFYRFNVPQAAINLQLKIKSELKLERKEILIVIDNAETLIESEEERAVLRKELQEISRRVGRVILTSRRWEQIEAYPIAVDILTEREALAFLRDRAEKLNIKIVNKASDADILESVKKLERRPIVLAAFANALVDPALKNIDQAASQVAAMLRKDLGEFLFSDAWARLNQDVRRLLLLMTRIGDVHDDQSLKICADVAGVSAQIAEAALQESGGIASMINVQGSLQIAFSRNFLEYAREKQVTTSTGAKSPNAEEITKARTAYSAFIQKAQRFTGDRFPQAFRTPQAKAAHRARQEGDTVEARRLYDAAVMTDSTNGWLLNRFAFFLSHDARDNTAALHQAQKAVELLPSEGEVWYTRGLIEARLGLVRECETSLAKAQQFGIEPNRCSMQRAWAYLKARPRQLGLAEKEINTLKNYLQSNAKDVRLQEEIRLLEGRLGNLRDRFKE
ncbi:M48 family metallopeptidase [Delftia sp. JD2]|uniref:tetratricopeptide repeat protein n=1 Tax=Delftia sp. JD2 TaxID=469553 RepID=UPI000A9002DA|nr:hypothetical protein [Delftia sp. JD2]